MLINASHRCFGGRIEEDVKCIISWELQGQCVIVGGTNRCVYIGCCR